MTTEQPVGDQSGQQTASNTDVQKVRLIQHVSHPIATMGQRFWAFLIDIIIVTVVVAIVLLVLALLTLQFGRLEIFTSAVLALSIVYFIVFESFDGQTIGKKVLHIKVVSLETMKKPDIIATVVRNVMRIIDSFPPNLYIIGFIVAILTERHQRLGDILARTIVVREEERIA